MKNKFISNLGDICLCIAVIMVCIANIMSARNIKLLENRIDELNAQIQEITVVNEETKQEIQKIASDTDAQFTIINESIDKNQKDNEKLNKEIQDLKKEPEISKEVNEVVEEKVAYEEPVQSMSVDEAVAEPEPEPVVESTPEPVPEVSSDNSGMTYMGCWEISAYEETGNCCANGNYPTPWYTCAFNSAPLGATIYVEELGYFVNEDVCGTPGRLDIYLGDVGACYEFGIQYHDVYIIY